MKKPKPIPSTPTLYGADAKAILATLRKPSLADYAKKERLLADARKVFK